MCNVVMWGAGKNGKVVIQAIKKDKCNFIGIIDSDKKRQKSLYCEKWKIISPEDIVSVKIDYVVISVKNSYEILQQCKEMGINDNKVIDYWKSDEVYEFIDSNVKKICELERELIQYKHQTELQFENLPYELGMRSTPIVRSAEELLDIIIKEKKSLSRFGDGELEVMRRRERLWYQKVDEKLADRLVEIFYSNDEHIIISLPDNFGNLEKYTESAAYGIRDYLSKGNRESLMEVIDMARVYYDAYVARPYMIYRDKQHAGHVFKLFKQVWEKRNILLVEGSRAYIGVRNNLFERANSIRRIIAPATNSFAKYDTILSLVKKHITKDVLVLVSLGPAATVLAYDLAKEGIQALDIGQLDNEYEWYLRGVDERVEIPGKCVAELSNCHEVMAIRDEEYEKQIVARVET